ncbi:MAG: class I SAM-dependent methyltransferase [Saprospiraceae bacterium]|nr:class I SAM-dependent methyltransferase [Saprospiraceae bacterium]
MLKRSAGYTQLIDRAFQFRKIPVEFLPLDFINTVCGLETLKRWFKLLHPGIQKLIMDYPVHMVPRYGHGKAPHQKLYEIVNANRNQYTKLLEGFDRYMDVFHSIRKAGEEKDNTMPVWNNGYLPGLDIMALFTIIADTKPVKYLEVGSGNSTKVAALAKKLFSPHTEIISIDPAPRAEIDRLADKIMRQPFETVHPDMLPGLQSGDILFIDNSHRILPNSDATVFFLEIFPALSPGVLVQIHDVYLPYDYPQFMCDRFYSEQYALACYLLANSEKYATLFPAYFISQDDDLSNRIEHLWENPNLHQVERHGGSFWLKIQH